MAVDSGTATLIMSYTLTAASFLIIFARIFLRRLRNEAFRADDWVMLAATPVYFLDMASYQVLITNGSNLGVVNPEALTKDEIDARVLGSKFSIVGRTCYLTYVWMLKTCILIYYSRLTSRTGEIKVVKLTGVLLVLTWIGCMLASLLQCRPFSGNWQVVPDPGPDCTIVSDFVITMGATNIATDLLLMSIPIPIILRARLPIRTKIHLCAVFLIGLFAVGITITRLVVVLKNFNLVNKLMWAQMENFAVTVVSNGPIIYGLYRKGRRHARGLGYRSTTGSNRKSNNGGPSTRAQDNTPSGIELSRVDKLNSSTWQILGDEGSAPHGDSFETLPHKTLAISRTVEVHQNTQKVESVSADVENPEVKTSVYGRQEW